MGTFCGTKTLSITYLTVHVVQICVVHKPISIANILNDMSQLFNEIGEAFYKHDLHNTHIRISLNYAILSPWLHVIATTMGQIDGKIS